ncbi:unnamed protein product [Paramecium pentaurelia]|uniref:Helicase ATP-binding domain-containing protein n=1 Tax=Paramecium pentaurelia TaxID=43138 RepID=A0A8S1XAY2_9CILI|nr:unnamed protein product [Paramecium pentaurelia]
MNKQNHIKLMDEDSQIQQAINLDFEIDQELCQKQEKLNLENTVIYFPHKPYDVQIKYMENVVQILDKKFNGLLESPTGTGKTLCLLCSSMGWLKKHREEQLISNNSNNLKIIYASRTHSQLKQVAQELKRTVYKPNISMIGSRDQYCLKNFQNLKGNSLIQACRKLVKGKKCQFYDKEFLPIIAATNSKLINTLEETKQFGFKNEVCPYYFERERLINADLIMIPYNYLLDNEFSNIVDVKNSIIIFDEAHNVPSTAEDGQSFYINDNIVQEAKKELERWLKQLDEIPDFLTGFQNVLGQKKFSKIAIKINEYEEIVQTIEAFSRFLKSLLESTQFNSQDIEQCKVFNAQQIFNFLYENTSINKKNNDSLFSNGINDSNISIYIEYCQTIINYMSEISPLEGSNLQSWTRFLMNLDNFTQDNEDNQDNEQLNYYDFYKLVVKKNNQNQISLNMWCLDPSLAFKKLLSQNIHSIILTSGTLSPMESWQSELKMEFQIQLSNKHVIDITKNVRAFVNQIYDFSYKNRDDEKQIIKLGETLLNFAQIIQGGIIVVFSSYTLMQHIQKKWSNQKLIWRLNEVKKCLWEEQGSSSFHNTLEVFKQNVQKGAILFAIHRGKVTEGIDLPDDLCRAIFLIGIPYPPLQDQKVKLKKEYLDKLRQGLSSKDWYDQQAIRATNQAIGRVVRHINDYGAIFLCDKRFQWSNMKNGISKWVQPAIKSWRTDQDIDQNIKLFFQRQTQQSNVIMHLKIDNQQSNQNSQEQVQRNIYQETQKQFNQSFRQSSEIQPQHKFQSQQQQKQNQQKFGIQYKDYHFNNKKQKWLLDELSDQDMKQFIDQDEELSSILQKYELVDQKQEINSEESSDQSQFQEESQEQSEFSQESQEQSEFSQESSQQFQYSKESSQDHSDPREAYRQKKIKYNKPQQYQKRKYRLN